MAHGWGVYAPNEGDPEVGRIVEIIGAGGQGGGCLTILDHQAGKDDCVRQIAEHFSDALVLIRFHLRNWLMTPPRQHIERIRDTMLSGPRPLARYTRRVVWANEQNLAAESEGQLGAADGRLITWQEWQEIARWNDAVLDAADELIRPDELRWHYPGVAYGHGEDWGYDRNRQPLAGFPLDQAGVPLPAYTLLATGINRCHVLNVHPYTQKGAQNADPWQGVERVERVHALFPHKALFAAEVGQFDIWHQQAPDQIVDIGYRLQGKPYVLGWTAFILNSSDPDHAQNNWSENRRVEEAYRRTTRLSRERFGDRTPGQGIVLSPLPQEPDQPPHPKPQPSRDLLVAHARRSVQRYPADLFVRQIEVESNFDPGAVSPAGAEGVAQIVRRWHPDVDPLDPLAALTYAARWMDELFVQYQDVVRPLIHYNGGGGAIEAWARGEPYDESVRYVTAVVSDLAVQQFEDDGRPARWFRELGFADAWIASACGPIAAAGLARSLGLQVDAAAALRVAEQQRLWTPFAGMGGVSGDGPTDFMLLCSALGMRPRAIQRAEITDSCWNGRPVVISTPRHYYLAQRPSRTDDELYVGNTGLARAGGAPWMSLTRIEANDTGINGLWVAERAEIPAEPPAPRPTEPIEPMPEPWLSADARPAAVSALDDLWAHIEGYHRQKRLTKGRAQQLQRDIVALKRVLRLEAA